MMEPKEIWRIGLGWFFLKKNDDMCVCSFVSTFFEDFEVVLSFVLSLIPKRNLKSQVITIPIPVGQKYRVPKKTVW